MWVCVLAWSRSCVWHTHTHTPAASVRFKIVLLIVWDTVGSAPQVIFYCSHSSIRVMLLPVLPDSCFITASLCVFLCYRLNDWSDVCFVLYFSLSYWLIWDLSDTTVLVYNRAVELRMESDNNSDYKKKKKKSVPWGAEGKMFLTLPHRLFLPNKFFAVYGGLASSQAWLFGTIQCWLCRLLRRL